MCVFMYACMHGPRHMDTHVFIYVCMYMCVCMFTRAHLRMYVFMSARKQVGIHARMFHGARICVHVSVHVYMPMRVSYTKKRARALHVCI